MNIELRTPNETKDRRYLIRTVVAQLALASVRREQILRAASSARILNRCSQTPSQSGSKFGVRCSLFGVFSRSVFPPMKGRRSRVGSEVDLDVFPTIAGADAPITLTDPNEAAEPQRFYRVAIDP